MGLIEFDFLTVFEWIWLAIGIIQLCIFIGGMLWIYTLKKRLKRKSHHGYQGKAVYVG
jgi:hypothetical protein